MAARDKAGIDMKVEFPELRKLQEAFRNLRPSLARKHIGAAIRRSLSPGLQALRSNVKRGPTGNLRRAITSKVKAYKSGNAVGLVGFVAAGSNASKSAGGGSVLKSKDRAYHAGFLEFGTKERKTKGPVASSFQRLGPFKIKPIAKRGKFAGAVRVQTTPKYPKAFFKKAPKGMVADVGAMPLGGSTGQPPVKSAYQKSLGTMRTQLAKEMTLALLKAQKDLADRFPRKATTGPLPF